MTASSSATEAAPAVVEPPPVRPVADGDLDPRPVAARGRAPRRSSRVVLGRVDPWAVLKLSLLFYLSLCVVLLVAGVLLWSAATSAGVVDNVESFISEIGFEDFRFLPGQILRASALGGLVLVVAGSCGNVLMAVLYNLISDVVGGLKVTLVEDDGNRTRV